jgi:DNA (cytosine-5)-methyltransferase 1
MIRTLSLFSGIGGFDLGVERTGLYEVVAQSEIDPYASRVLSKHWPTVPNLGDITAITEAHLEPIGRIDAVIGGFPCQDLSVAGKQGGIRAARSGLFFELMRIVRMVRPSLVILENVPTLLSRADWMGAVLGEMAESGFDAEWDCIPAQAVGAHHRRDRVFIVAYADSAGLEPDDRRAIPDEQRDDPTAPPGRTDQPNRAGAVGQDVADAVIGGRSRDAWRKPSQQPADGSRWAAEPGMGRMAHGVSSRVDRLRGLGNAVVPQVAEHVARIAASRTYARQRNHPKPHQPTTHP